MLDIKIYEILYGENQRLTDASFTGFKVENYQPEWREFRHLIDYYRAGGYLKHDFSGLFSPKFSLKTKIMGCEFLEFCQKNSSADVIFINPFPQIEHIYFNVWEQGECWHPGLINAANTLLSNVGFNIDVSCIKRQTSRELLFSNFWVGNEKFWSQYIGDFLNPIALYLESESGRMLSQDLNKPTYHTTDCGYLPFIIERLFSTFLCLNSNISSKGMLVNQIEPYFIHPFEKRAVQIGKKLASQYQDDTELKLALNRLSRVTTRIGKRYFSKKIHPHIKSKIIAN